MDVFMCSFVSAMTGAKSLKDRSQPQTSSCRRTEVKTIGLAPVRDTTAGLFTNVMRPHVRGCCQD